MNTFPTITQGPSRVNFSDEPSNDAVIVASTASGYPVLNPQFTFDARTFTFILPNVPNADKLTLMTFYDDNKDVTFYWTNEQDDTEYEVIFVDSPKCRIGGRIDFWNILLKLRQSTP